MEAWPRPGAGRTLETLNFDNLSLRALPLDPQSGGPPRQVSV